MNLASAALVKLYEEVEADRSATGHFAAVVRDAGQFVFGAALGGLWLAFIGWREGDGMGPCGGRAHVDGA